MRLKKICNFIANAFVKVVLPIPVSMVQYSMAMVNDNLTCGFLWTLGTSGVTRRLMLFVLVFVPVTPRPRMS